MDNATFRVFWIGTCAATGLAVIIALLSTVGTLPRWSLTVLVALGGLSFSFTAIGLDWVELRPTNFKSVSIFCAIWIGMSILGLASWWNIEKEKPESPTAFQLSPKQSAPAPVPVIDVVMMIDSVGKKYINFHLDMENLSQVQITDIGVAFQSEDASSMDVAPQIFRSMSSKDKLSTNVGLFVLNARNYNSASVFITYSAEVESTARKFTAVYKFLFGLDEAKKKLAIHPDNIVRKEGQLSEEERFRDQLNARLSKEEGTIQVSLPEITPDGKPNLTRFGDSRTNFLFDAQANLVLFRRLNNSGKWLQASEAMRSPSMTIGAVHVITVTWSNEEVSLFIDGAKRVQSKPNE